MKVRKVELSSLERLKYVAYIVVFFISDREHVDKQGRLQF